MNVGMQLSARQQLAMTPELQHSIWLLQLSGVEFEQAVEDALVANPFLERDESEGNQSDDAVGDGSPNDFAGSTLTPAATPADEETAGSSATSTLESPDAADDLDAGEWPRATASRIDDDEQGFGSFSPAAVGLREHLLQQIGACRLEPRDRELAEMVVHALDPDGYLRESFDDLRALVSPAAEDDEIEIALRMVQSLEPAGVGARSTVECLRLQLAQMHADPEGSTLAKRMLEVELEATASHDTVRLKKVFGCDDAALRAAYGLIRRCNPRPGAAFGVDDTRYVVADVIVRKQGKRWVASINPEVVPKIQLNKIYADILHQQRSATGTPMGQQLQEARWFVRNVQQRFATIGRVAQALVERQSRFFDYGDVAMKPLVLRDIADELGLHESTISRVTSNKYMATPRGLIELKYFFGSHVESEGNACSSTAVRALIRQIISEEDRDHPLSDIKVTKALSTKGVQVARRTVSKYRDAMQIPPVEARRMSVHA